LPLQYSYEDGRKSSDVGAIPCGCPELLPSFFNFKPFSKKIASDFVKKMDYNKKKFH